MSEQNRIIQRLRDAEVANAIRWAYVSATGRTLDDFSEDAGHDAAWLGSTRFTLLRDRLDRVFSCARYGIQAGTDPSRGIDLLHVELTKQDIATMPTLVPGTVRRADLNNSPGWVFEDFRFLLASCAFGKIDRLPWPQKSATKQQVASQLNPDPVPSLFDEFADGEVGGLVAAMADPELDLDTFVVAHALDPVSKKAELVFGRPRINDGGGQAWHWYKDLLDLPPIENDRKAPSPPSPAPDTAPDAAVRLRRDAGAANRKASDQR